jgi:amino-acid N-acetyltransferase
MMNHQSDGIIFRKARPGEAFAIAELINHFANRGMMLPKTPLDVFQALREFTVAVDEHGTLLGCGALRLMWEDLAEVRSLAVHKDAQGKGLGRKIVKMLIEEGKEMGLARIFALTYQDVFFEKLGFEICSKDIFPQKVWTDCRACPKRHCCDEIAMLLVLDEERAAKANAEARAQLLMSDPSFKNSVLLDSISIAA